MTEEIQYKTDIKPSDYRNEYILPCMINIPSEDDVVIDFVPGVSMVIYSLLMWNVFNYFWLLILL